MAVDKTISEFSKIDVLFNNAGIAAYGLSHELTEEEWDNVLDINLKGAWLVARRIIPHMIEKKSGVILVNSSIAGLYFLGIFIYLFTNVVIPLTSKGEWRGPADVIAVGFYLSGIIPFLGMLLLEIGMIGRNRDEVGKLKLHAIFVGIFLIVAHIAMIFGMLDPNLFIMKAM